MEREVKLEETDLLEEDYTRLSDFCLTSDLLILLPQWKNKNEAHFPH